MGRACCRLPHRSLLQAGQAKVSLDVTRADAVGLAAGLHRPKRQQAVAIQGAPHATLPVSLIKGSVKSQKGQSRKSSMSSSDGYFERSGRMGDF